MIRVLLGWVAPGVLTVMCGTLAALATTMPVLVSDLDEEGHAALQRTEMAWAKIEVKGRVLHLEGTTSTEYQRVAALQELAAIPCVRLVEDNVTVAPLLTPYRVDVSVEDGRVTLSGSVPNQLFIDRFEGLPGVVADLSIRSGQPDESVWRGVVDFILAQSAWVQSGRFEITDHTLNVSVTAASGAGLGRLQMALAELPSGIDSGEIKIEPAIASPYLWMARWDGERIEISGNVPDQPLVDRLRVADLSGGPVATGLTLASGAPEGFAERAILLVQQLSRLDYGEASIVDGMSRLSGRPPNVQVAQSVTETLSGTGSIVSLEPPRIADYWVSVSRQSGGTLVFDGYVPDTGMREAFAGIANADVSFLRLGQGEPKIYRAAVDFGISLLSHVSEGRIALRENTFSITGTARSSRDYEQLAALLEDALPAGITLGEVDFRAPSAARYSFSLRKAGNGDVILSGMLPNPTIARELREAIDGAVTSEVTYASGEPLNFSASLDQASQFLPWLANGEISFDGTGWLVSGTPASALDAAAIDTEFAVRGLVRSGWTLNLSEPVTAVPYTWSATRDAGGGIVLSGNVPAAAMQQYLSVRLSGDLSDNTVVQDGAPEGFGENILHAIDILAVLETGTVRFDGSKWSAEGVARLPDGPETVANLLGSGVSNWQLAISAGTLPEAEQVAVATEQAALDAPEVQSPETPQPAMNGDANALALCRDEVAELTAHNAILFQSGAAIIAESANSELDAFAAVLARCPTAFVYVEGHTDSDGDDQKNLALSVARAEAVVNAFVTRGIAPERLYAIGYGESQPVADNATSDGKRQNRRIVVTADDNAR